MPKQYDRTDVFNDGSLILYRRRPREDGKKPAAFWARYKLREGTNHIEKTTGYNELPRARDYASAKFNMYKDRLILGFSLEAKTVEDVINSFIKKRTIDFEKGEIGKPHYKTTVRSANILKKIFKNCKTFEETSKGCHSSIEQHCKKNITNHNQYKDGKRTEFQYKVFFKQIWQFAIDERFVDSSLMPTDGQIKFPIHKPTKIESFSDLELQHIIKYLRDFPTHEVNYRLCYNYDYYWPLVSYYIFLLIYSGLRTSEAKKLQWKDISFVKQGYEDFEETLFSGVNLNNTIVYIRLPSTKSKIKISRTILCRWEYTDILLEHFKWAKYNSPEDYLFANQLDGSQLSRFESSFRRLMDYMTKRYKDDTGKDGIRTDINHNTRTQYTFRHTYINLMIDDGCDVFDLAEMCGHSVETMRKFYNDREDKRKRLHKRQMPFAQIPFQNDAQNKIEINKELERKNIENQKTIENLQKRLEELTKNP